MRAIYKKTGEEVELVKTGENWTAINSYGSKFPVADSTKKRWYKVLAETAPKAHQVETIDIVIETEPEDRLELTPIFIPVPKGADPVDIGQKWYEDSCKPGLVLVNEKGEELDIANGGKTEPEDLSPNGVDSAEMVKRVPGEDEVILITADEISKPENVTRTWLMVFQLPGGDELHVIDRAYGSTNAGTPDRSTAEAYIVNGENKRHASYGIKKTIAAWCAEHDEYIAETLVADIKALRKEYFSAYGKIID